MTEDLKKLQEQGWELQEGKAGGGTTANRSKQVITVDGNDLKDPANAVQSIAHETGHALYTPKNDFSSKDSYLNSALSDEGAATLKNIEVRREILSNGGEDIGVAGNYENTASYNRVYDELQSGAKTKVQAEESIGRIFGKGEVTSNTGQTYEDYYGGWYDKNFPAK